MSPITDDPKELLQASLSMVVHAGFAPTGEIVLETAARKIYGFGDVTIAAARRIAEQAKAELTAAGKLHAPVRGNWRLIRE